MSTAGGCASRLLSRTSHIMLQIFEKQVLPAGYLLLSLFDCFDLVWEGVFSRR